MITLYSTNCPKCNVLSKKLSAKNIEYNVVTDINKMEELGFSSAPMLDVDGKVMNFSEANNWVNKYGA